MARGYPDWSPGAARSAEGEFLPTVAQPPIWLKDDFDTPDIKWRVVSGIATIEVGNASVDFWDAAYSGAGYIDILADLGQAVQLRRAIGIPPIIDNIGVEVTFRLYTKSDFSDETIAFEPCTLYIKVNSTLWYVRTGINPTNNKIYISVDNAEPGTLIGTINSFERGWHTIKVIANITTGKWVSLYLDGETFDLSAYSLYSEPSTDLKYFYAYIIARSDIGDQARIGIDNFKLTYSES